MYLYLENKLYTKNNTIIEKNDVFNKPEAEWTYKIDSNKYGKLGVKGAINLSIIHMKELYEVLNSNNIKLSIGVYPWPAQLLENNLSNNKQAQVWREFCNNRCEMYIDTFPVFDQLVKEFGVMKVYSDYFINGDIHFNKRGNEIIFEVLDKKYKDYLASNK